MTYFNLRKRDPGPDEEAVEEDLAEGGEEPEEPAQEAKERAVPDSWGGALWYGISGPSVWIYVRLGIEAAIILHLFLLWTLAVSGTWAAAGTLTGWLAAVLAFIPREFLERAAEAVELLFSAAPKLAVTVPPGGEREAVRRLLLDLIGEAHGVHLKTVLAHLQDHGQWEGKKVADLRVHLQALGIPVDPKLRVGKVPTRGVSRTALEALPPIEETPPSPAPSPPV